MRYQQNDEPEDIHSKLMPYKKALLFFEKLERNGDVKSYCNGANTSGRWIFQIYNKEFISEIATIINRSFVMNENDGPVLEIMSGDGRLTEFLQILVKRKIIATDAKDGRYNIAYPKWVETLDAIESVEKYQPSFVILSWEPYLSISGIEIVKRGIPMAWIGNPSMCGHPDLFDFPHTVVKSEYALSRHDAFIERKFKTDIYLFNCNLERETKSQ